MVIRTTVLVLILLFAAPVCLMAAQVSAVADRDRLAAGESLRLELRVQGSPDNDPDLSVLEADWEILSRSQSSQMSIVNGDFSRSVVYSLILMPRRNGELNIPAVCFGSDCSTPLPIRVSEEVAASPAGAAPLLLEAEAAPQRVAAGAQVLLTVRLLHRGNLAQASLSEPQPEGVATEVQKIGEDRSFEVHRDGYLYRAVERRYALFPQAAGTLRIPGLQLDAQVSSGPAQFDPFGRSLKPLRRRSEPIEIRVEPPSTDHAWLPASSVSLEDDWQGKVVRMTAGEPATRTLILSVAGLPAARLPTLPLNVPDGFKSYPDQPERTDQPGEQGITGRLQQKLALVATRPGHYRLPAIDLDWWDTAQQRWQQAHLNEVELEVAPAAGAASAGLPQASTQPVATTAPPPLPPAVASGKTPSAATAPGTPPAEGFWPWLSLALALGWLATLALFWRQRRRSAAAAASVAQTGRGESERQARQALLRAARSDDPRATRQALLAWSRALWPESAVSDLEQLAGRCGDPLAGELAALSQTLYGASPRAWQGGALAAAVEHWCRQRSPANRQDLPPLYPEPRQQG